ncbi:MAG: response regulator transcription factor [Cupriavidus sp.]|nr:response regulator transcription factor [Cupriavidus sp.]
MQNFSIRTIFAGDRPLVRVGVEHIAESNSAIELVSIQDNVEDFIASLATGRCDVMLIDYAIRSKGALFGITLLEYLRRTYPKIGIVVLLTHENPVIIRSIHFRNISGIVSKFDEVEHIVKAIHSAYGGGQYLSPTIRHTLEGINNGMSRRKTELSSREAEVIRLYLSGMTISEIANKTHKAKQTVSTQKMRAMQKLGVKNDIELMRCAVSLSLVDGASTTLRTPTGDGYAEGSMQHVRTNPTLPAMWR